MTPSARFGAISDLILAPLMEHLRGADHLIIVPHGPLHSVPFAALREGERFLIERFAISHVPSASVTVHLRSARRRQPRGGRAVVGVSDSLAPLINAEARTIASALGAAHLEGEDATVAGATRALADADIAHLACHGRFVASNPMASGLRLADRWLTVRDVYRMRLAASLITLSGCETGAHAIESGDEMVGLIRAFLAAGASALCVSLWTVHDAATTELMQRFYERVLSNDSSRPSVADAMRSAQLETMGDHPHPAHWAPFVLVGAT